MENKNTIKYFIYARKSSESDEKQVQSIDDQILVMNGIAKSYGFKIVDIISESKSAKEPHGRPEFEKMIERFQKGEAQGVLVWKIDRLSRNPIDSATIQWFLQKGVIASIRTPDREYRPEDNALLLSVESSMANQYIRDLSTNVKRGLKSKLEKGWMPCTAPLGYLNTKTEIRGENYIIKDTERFDLIRKGWDLLLTGNYNVVQVMRKLNEWGFRTRAWKRRGNKPLAKSTVYKIFNNVFYAGIIPYKDLYVQGKHDTMITIEEFDRVQVLLGKKGKPRPHNYEYAYTGQIVCGDCGGVVSATFKEKIIKKTNKLQSYILYYCICARKHSDKCPDQKHYTNSDKIDEKIEKELISLTILPEFKDWALAIIAEKNDEEITNRTKIYETQQKAVNETQKQIDNLTQLRLKDMIDDDEYTKEKTRLKNELALLRTKMKGTEERADNWLKLTEQTFEFACYAHKAFMFGDIQTKREILGTISRLNSTLKDHILNVTKVEWLVPIEKQYPLIKEKYDAFELKNKHNPQRQKDAFASLSPLMRSRRGLNPQPPT